MNQAYGWHTVPLTAEVIPEQVRTWLTLTEPLTAHLKQQLPPHRLAMWRQGLEPPPIHEQLLLHLTAPASAWIRQIFHYLGDDIVVYARTVVPENIYKEYQDILDNLGTKPIGAAFLYEKAWRRSAFTFGCITPAGLLHDAATQAISGQKAKDLAEQLLPARRSLFDTGKGYILLTEVFLPALLAFQPNVLTASV